MSGEGRRVGVGGLEDERVGGWKGESGKGEGVRVERGRVGG